MDNKLKVSVFLVAVLCSLSLYGNEVQASEVAGNLSSDFATLSGVVVSPPADNTPPPVANNNGGGNTGGGNTAANTSALTTAQKPYDTNNDDKIDVLDFNALIVHWGEKGTGIVGDFDKNGVVDVFDFNALMVHWTA